MIRRVLLILFLYEVLVWTVSYLYAPPTIVQTAVFWSALGVALLLLGIIGERFVEWWRAYRAKRAKVSAPADHPKAPPQSEEAAAFAGLIAQANARLAESPRQGGTAPLRLTDMPLYLVIGPSGAGKTALMHSSGIEPIPLAGQALTPAGDIATTRVGNIWLARQCVFLEISGRIFDADPARLTEIVNVLLGRADVSRWRALFAPPQPAVDLRAALLACDASAFIGEPDASNLDRLSQPLRERLGVLTRSAGHEVPVYVVLTRADRIGGFPEFFCRSGPGDLEQVFGVLNRETPDADPENRVWADRESKRLGRDFQALLLRLDERRRLALTMEGDSARKPAIYEFPREFKKIRTPLVQFLVDVFRPDPLRLGPRLAGFFFTGVVPQDAPRATGEDSPAMVTLPGVSDATDIFRADRTVMLKRSGVPVDRERRTFASEFFQKVVLHHRPVSDRPVAVSSFGPQQRIATAIASGVALLLAIVWSVSWWNNRTLAAEFAKAVAAARAAPADLSLAGLTALDGLRQQLVQAEASDSLSHHWGLYQGEKLRQAASAIYFERLKRVSLGRIDGTLASQLLSAAADFQTSPDLVYDELKTYRTISGACTVDQPLVLRVLQATAAQTHRDLGSEQAALLGRQLDYYSRNLRPVPVRLDQSEEAEEKARGYIRQAGGVEPQFRVIVAGLQDKLGKLVVRESVDYQGLMDGPPDISKVFTPPGIDAFEQAVAKDNSEGDKDRCVMGESKEAAPASTKDELKARYYHEYAVKWREFLAACKIRPFGKEDAPRRLAALTDAGRSPLLGVVKLIAVNAEVALPSETGVFQAGVEAVKKAVSSKDPRKGTPIAGLGLLGGGAPPTQKAHLQAMVMQPALLVIPPPFDRTVNDNNAAYIKGLRDLADAIDTLAHAAQPEQAAKAAEADAVLGKARDAHRTLTDRFSRSDPAGLANPMADFLEQPIRFAAAIIKQPIKPPRPVESDIALRQLCTKLAPTLALYPFKPDSEDDADPQKLKEAFTPKSGLIWKYAEPNDLVARQGTDWQEKPGLPGYHVSPDLIKFLNAAQQLTDGFFAGGELHVDYTLRPCSVHPECDGLKLTLDGKEISPTSVMQVSFRWPAASTDRIGVEATRVLPGGSYGFGQFDDLWGVFRFFQSADGRPLGSARVTWCVIRGGGKAKEQQLNPPAQIDLVGVTPRTDVLNPAFFKDLQACPVHAITGN